MLNFFGGKNYQKLERSFIEFSENQNKQQDEVYFMTQNSFLKKSQSIF
jgi:hypothetical protein